MREIQTQKDAALKEIADGMRAVRETAKRRIRHAARYSITIETLSELHATPESAAMTDALVELAWKALGR